VMLRVPVLATRVVASPQLSQISRRSSATRVFAHSESASASPAFVEFVERDGSYRPTSPEGGTYRRVMRNRHWPQRPDRPSSEKRFASSLRASKSSEGRRSQTRLHATHTCPGRGAP